jgi:hypothetical protein
LTHDGRVAGRCGLPDRPERAVTLDDSLAVIACGRILVIVPVPAR